MNNLKPTFASAVICSLLVLLIGCIDFGAGPDADEIEIIGEDSIRDLDPETIYFLNKILNQLNLKKIRNNILSEVLPVRV